MVQIQPYQNQAVSSQAGIFSPEQIRNLSGLGDVLRQIRTRLRSEGVSIEEARQKLLKSYELQKAK